MDRAEPFDLHSPVAALILFKVELGKAPGYYGSFCEPLHQRHNLLDSDSRLSRLFDLVGDTDGITSGATREPIMPNVFKFQLRHNTKLDAPSSLHEKAEEFRQFVGDRSIDLLEEAIEYLERALFKIGNLIPNAGSEATQSKLIADYSTICSSIIHARGKLCELRRCKAAVGYIETSTIKHGFSTNADHGA
jgi:hypothetical protein